MALLTMLGAVALLAFRKAFGLWGPLGSDAVLWELSALNLTVGSAPVVPPAYPAASALLALLPGIDVLHAGLLVSAAAFVALPATVFRLGRDLGFDRKLATLAALVPLASAELLAFGLQEQPDAFTAFFLVIAVIALLAYHQRGGWGATVGIALLGALAPLVREHGLVLSILLLPNLLLRPGRRDPRLRWRLAVLAAGLGLWITLPLAFHGNAGLPWQQAWQSRSSDALSALLARHVGAYGDRLPRAARATLEHMHQKRKLAGIIWFHASRALGQEPAGWTWLGLGLLGASASGRKRGFALALALVPSLLGLAIWSQARHVLVAVPVAVVASFAGFLRAQAALAHARSRRCPSEEPGRTWSRWRIAVVGLPSLGLCVPWLVAFPRMGGELAVEAGRLEAVRSFGEALCRMSTPDDLLAGPFPEVMLFCPRRRNVPALDGDAADWHTFWVSSVAPATGWERVEGESLTFPVYRLRPDLSGPDRPCAGSRPVPHTPYQSVPLAAVWMDPPCSSPPPTLPEVDVNHVTGRHPALRGLPGRPGGQAGLDEDR
jgi:hypothetical protein